MLPWILLGAATAAQAQRVSTTTGATVNKQGVTELYGNKFGRPGYNDTFDYVIIGGGNAGATIAARLALDPANYSVAVIETGDFYELTDGNRTQVPGLNFIDSVFFPNGDGPTAVLYAMETEPQPGYDDRQLNYYAGHTFGGSTASNAMAYHRATVGSFDQWVNLTGDDFWSWENAYAAYKKSCKFHPPDYTKIDPSLNITWDPSAFDDEGGPLHVSYGNYQGPFGPSMDIAMEKAGLAPIGSFNSGNLMGYGTLTVTVDTDTATRSSSETSFLQAGARGSDQFKIYPNTQAKRITFDDAKKATGVEVQANFADLSMTYNVQARKEVIVSAGVWHSPQLLMVSGIGPAETLKQHGIDVVVDSPGVGQNEEDQPTVPGLFKVNVTTYTQLMAGNEAVMAAAVEEYLNHQSGQLSASGAGKALAFEKIPEEYRKGYSNSTLAALAKYPEDWPEVEWAPYEPGMPATGEVGPDDYYLSFSGVMLAALSRGNMTITSADMADPPVVNPNWLGAEGDAEQAYGIVQRMREIASYASIIQEEILPPPNVTGKEDTIKWLRDNMAYIFHGSSTCRMGPDDNPENVVDSRARVKGVTGLRVVDASSFPSLPPGHPMSTVYMFAERIAESILGGN
ncbi:oxidoreductase [Hypoxylon sp. FL1284]|nr:oxidoreductase [Hypoxylon sp. FL1284]